MTGHRFPIQSQYIKSIPWAMIASCEKRAIRNHDQTLSELARRGGLDPAEALLVLDDKSWDGRVFLLPAQREERDRSHKESAENLLARVDRWLAEHPEEDRP